MNRKGKIFKYLFWIGLGVALGIWFAITFLK